MIYNTISIHITMQGSSDSPSSSLSSDQLISQRLHNILLDSLTKYELATRDTLQRALALIPCPSIPVPDTPDLTNSLPLTPISNTTSPQLHPHHPTSVSTESNLAATQAKFQFLCPAHPDPSKDVVHRLHQIPEQHSIPVRSLSLTIFSHARALTPAYPRT